MKSQKGFNFLENSSNLDKKLHVVITNLDKKIAFTVQGFSNL